LWKGTRNKIKDRRWRYWFDCPWPKKSFTKIITIKIADPHNFLYVHKHSSATLYDKLDFERFQTV